MSPEELEFGQEYKTDSHMGGVFSIMYMGPSKYNKHIFVITNKGWEKELLWTDEQVSRLVLEA